jgi:hypothetical protein
VSGRARALDRAGSDAERQCQHGHRGEAWRAAEHAQGVANILPSIGDEVCADHAAPPSFVDGDTFLARVIEIAEPAQGQLARAFGRLATIDQFADPHFKVEGQFVLHITAGIEAEQPTEAPPPRGHHQPPLLEGCASNAANTAAA